MICKDRKCEYVILTCLFDGGDNWHLHYVTLLTIAGYVSPVMMFVHVKCRELTFSMNQTSINKCN